MKMVLHLGAWVGLLSGVAGCRLLNDEAVVQHHSPLQPARTSPDSVTMEIIWVRFPAGDPDINCQAWSEIDETQITPAVRRELANNGIRAGVLGTRLPPAIAQALHPDDPVAENTPHDGAYQAAPLAAEPVVHGRVQRLRRNQRSEIQASEIHPVLSLLVCGDRELSGQTYQQAQAIYALRVDPQPDRMVLVDLTPELHYGAPRVRLTGGEEGVMRLDSSKEREVFDRLRMQVKLSPGEMLVLTSLPDAGSRLGHYFHTVESADGPQQKLILIRLADVPPSDTFAGSRQ
jgi:hypothetical protein